MILNGWQRIGISLTVLWIFLMLCIAGAELLDIPMFQEFSFVDYVPLKTTDEIKKIPGFTRVTATLSIGRVLLVVLVVPLAAWSLIYAAIAVFRWIKLGFEINRRP